MSTCLTVFHGVSINRSDINIFVVIMSINRCYACSYYLNVVKIEFVLYSIYTTFE